MSLKRQFLWSMTPLLVVTLVNFFSVPLFVRFLGKDLYAVWVYVGTFTGVFGFADLGLGVAVGRYVGVALGEGKHQLAREYWGTGNLIALPLLGLMAVAFALVGVLFGPHLLNVSAQNEVLLRWCFLVGGVGLFCGFYTQFWLILLQAHLEFRFSSLLRTAASLLQVLPALFIAYFTGNPVWVGAWTALVFTAQLGTYMWFSRRHYKMGLELRFARLERAREMALYTGKTFASLVLTSLFGNLDRLLLGKMAPSTAFANYVIASNAGARIQNLGVAVMGPVFHNTSRTVGGNSDTTPADVYSRSFDFLFGWYLLLGIWATVWHPVLLRLWLGQQLGAEVTPVFAPVIVGFCLTAIGNISGAQLGPLDRVGTGLFFTLLTSALVGIGVYFGWRWAGATGVAYGFLFSRLGLLVQDVFVIRLIGAGGWLALKTWFTVGAQVLVGLSFAAVYLLLPATSFWLLVPALAHGSLVAGWLLRSQLRKLLGARTKPVSRLSAMPTTTASKT